MIARPAVSSRPLPVRDGVAVCTRYAFGPNRLHLCGPDMNQEVLSYLNTGAIDSGLTNIIVKFQSALQSKCEAMTQIKVARNFNRCPIVPNSRDGSR